MESLNLTEFCPLHLTCSMAKERYINSRDVGSTLIPALLYLNVIPYPAVCIRNLVDKSWAGGYWKTDILGYGCYNCRARAKGKKFSTFSMSREDAPRRQPP